VTPDPIITLTTDFGEDSPYVAAMKGVILAINPKARLVDLGHQIPPQDLRHAAFYLKSSIPFFPPGVIHVIVVDPGVGTDRALLYVEVEGHRLLVPDNGCWTELARDSGRATHSGASGPHTPVWPPTVIRLTESKYWRNPVSPTFHGRDILAPVAAHLSLGEDPQKLGPLVHEWVRLEIPSPVVEASRVIGEVIYVDHFGNLITNIPKAVLGAMLSRSNPDQAELSKSSGGRESMPPAELPGGAPIRILVGDQEVTRLVQAYGEAASGTLVALMSSAGLLEIAITGGNAAEKLRAGVGSIVSVHRT
jgi:S-adenosylmethionine hydrolase